MKFKAISQAHEILYDDEKRELYDAHGMAAFESGRGGGMGGGVDMEDILAQMFGMGGGMPGMGGAGARRPKKGADEQKPYSVTLEELYEGKTVKFAVTKNVLCNHCKGRGGKESAKAKQCQSCKGKGKLMSRLRPIHRQS